MPDKVAAPQAKAPPLAAEAIPSHDVRLEDILQGQQDVMNLVLSGAALPEVLDRVVLVVEAAFAPALAAISLVQRDGRVVKWQAAPNFSAEMRDSFGVAIDGRSTNPTTVAAATGERIIISHSASDRRWPEHADIMLSHGLQSCWVEPIPDCGEGLFGIVTLYCPEPRDPGEPDERILWTLTSFIAFVLNAAQREAAFRAANERFAALVSAIPGVATSSGSPPKKSSPIRKRSSRPTVRTTGRDFASGFSRPPRRSHCGMSRQLWSGRTAAKGTRMR